MKRYPHLFASAFLLLFVACGKTPDPTPGPTPDPPQPQVIAVSSVSLDKTEMNLFIGESQTLAASVKPDNATDKTVTWSTSNAGVATVDNGKVTAVKEGEATIRAQAGGKEASCKVKVAAHEVKVLGSISSDAAILHGAGGQTAVSIIAEASWNMTSDADWLTVSPSSGSAGVGQITITSAPNTTSAIRTGCGADQATPSADVR